MACPIAQHRCNQTIGSEHQRLVELDGSRYFFSAALGMRRAIVPATVTTSYLA